MIAFPVVLCLISSTVVLRVEESNDLLPDETASLTRAIASEIAAVTGAQPKIDDGIWSTCEPGEERCVSELAARTGSTDIVLLRFYGVRTKLLILAERSSTSTSPVKLDETIPRAADLWREPLHKIATVLFPEGKAAVATPVIERSVPKPVPEDDGGPALGSWIAFGAGAVALGAGIGFGVSSANARSELSSTDLQTDHDIKERQERFRDHELAAGVLLGTAAVAVVVGVVLGMID